jgi:hypothetical protein
VEPLVAPLCVPFAAVFRELSVTARQLLALFDSIYLAALSIWIGSAVFMVFGLAPVLLRAIDSESASKLARVIFPRYYAAGAIAGAIALPSFVAGPLCYSEYRGAMVAVQALAIIFGILLMLYGANSIVPAIGGREGGAGPGPLRAAHSHRQAVGLNVIVMLVAFSLVIAYVLRPAPKTSGIIEMTPQERARYDAALYRVIEDVEAKYRLRPPHEAATAESPNSDSLIDPESVRELESYYAKKRLRDQARAGRTPSGGNRP